jgi:hypothetical protein
MNLLVSRAAIDAAKQRLRIPDLWRLLHLPGQPRASCRSPFRDDKRASFSIFDEGRQAKDHGTGEDFDAPAFLAKALGLSAGQALQRFIAMVGGEDIAEIDCSRWELAARENLGVPRWRGWLIPCPHPQSTRKSSAAQKGPMETTVR